MLSEKLQYLADWMARNGDDETVILEAPAVTSLTAVLAALAEDARKLEQAVLPPVSPSTARSRAEAAVVAKPPSAASELWQPVGDARPRPHHWGPRLVVSNAGTAIQPAPSPSDDGGHAA